MGKEHLDAVAEQEKLVDINPLGKGIVISGKQGNGSTGAHHIHEVENGEFEAEVEQCDCGCHAEGGKPYWGTDNSEVNTEFMSEKEQEVLRELQEEREVGAFVTGVLTTGVVVGAGVLGYFLCKKRGKKKEEQAEGQAED